MTSKKKNSIYIELIVLWITVFIGTVLILLLVLLAIGDAIETKTVIETYNTIVLDKYTKVSGNKGSNTAFKLVCYDETNTKISVTVTEHEYIDNDIGDEVTFDVVEHKNRFFTNMKSKRYELRGGIRHESN